MSGSPLPPTFTSVYRLFLRTTSASVLHHRGATRNLRKLWRPTFEGAAQVIRQIQAGPKDSASQKELHDWLKVWEHRVDNTLALLYTSSKSRGLPHQLTRNLALLNLGQHQWLSQERYRIWKPPSKEPPQPPTQKQLNKEAKQERWNVMDDNAWAALAQVVNMAEGRHGISLGRVTVKGRITQKS